MKWQRKWTIRPRKKEKAHLRRKLGWLKGLTAPKMAKKRLSAESLFHICVFRSVIRAA
jgi:hypothetical protein